MQDLSRLDDSNQSEKTREKNSKINHSIKNEDILQLKSKIRNLTYEESLTKLEDIVNDLKLDSVNLKDIQRNYLEGKLYLKRCEELLNIVEQEITNINSEDLDLS